MRLVELDKENFDALVTEAQCPVLVEFFSPGCGPCHALAAVLEEMADAYPHVRFAAMDSVRFPDVAWAFDVAAAPSLLLFSGGRRIDAVTGYVPRARVEEMLADVE